VTTSSTKIKNFRIFHPMHIRGSHSHRPDLVGRSIGTLGARCVFDGTPFPAVLASCASATHRASDDGITRWMRRTR